MSRVDPILPGEPWPDAKKVVAVFGGNHRMQIKKESL